MRSRYGFAFGVAAVVLVLDQATKWYIRQTVKLNESIAVIDSLFNITHVSNKGAAFSLFADSGAALRLPFFLSVSIVAIIVLILIVRRVEARQYWLLFGLGSILGGALGNFVDRVRVGEVTDYLDVHWHGYHWPAFNVADSFISIGMVILVLYSLLSRPVPHQAGNRQRVSPP